MSGKRCPTSATHAVDTDGAFVHGKKSSIGASAVQLTTASVLLTKGVLLRRPNAETGTVYLGASNAVTTDDGYPLGPGESITLEIDDPSKIWLIADGAGKSLHWLAV